MEKSIVIESFKKTPDRSAGDCGGCLTEHVISEQSHIEKEQVKSETPRTNPNDSIGFNFELPLLSPLMPELYQANFFKHWNQSPSLLKSSPLFVRPSEPHSPVPLSSEFVSCNEEDPLLPEHPALTVEAVQYSAEEKTKQQVHKRPLPNFQEQENENEKSEHLSINEASFPNSPMAFNLTSTPIRRVADSLSTELGKELKGTAAVTKPAMQPPLIVVSPAGLITVVLKKQVAVEMSLDRAVRLINPRHQSAVAINNKGDEACIVQRSLKIYQSHTSLEISASAERYVQINEDSMLFASREGCYRIVNDKLYAAKPTFSDLSHDMSVTLLFSASGYGPHLLLKCQQVTERARYENADNGATLIWINGIRVKQLPNGDACVTNGEKFMRVSPTQGSATVATAHVNLKTDGLGWMKVHYGRNFVEVAPNSMLVSNRSVEGGFDSGRNFFFKPTPSRFRVHDDDKWDDVYEDYQRESDGRKLCERHTRQAFQHACKYAY
ncbi:hypothetical protein CAPTEDRAFT_217072 [Capitella teleta]|uniref:Uncharacterized protein n=1 Tax=Capitella teleta TaxID=283909 RepID=R7TU71_CAPTE|nr:hypothetical protein CAPTEDRAFT_217072 [Capitella teleta]|eukprot:ELT94570.1 hypothetical protein CAPTEDRAFT_217072 [Capitella teleta]